MKRLWVMLAILLLSLVILDRFVPYINLTDIGEFTGISNLYGQNNMLEDSPAETAIWDTDWSNTLNILLTLALASLLSGLVSYRRKGGQSQMDFTEAHVVLSASAALMMMIIGSQLARAFGLMGAASIVRYRYSLKSPKEASSLVIALGIGMACGVGLYPLAVITALYITLMANVFEYMPQGLRQWLFPANIMWNARIRTLDAETTLEELEDYLDSEGIDYKIKRVLDGKGAENNLTEIDIDIFSDIDRHEFGERFKHVSRIRWKRLDKEGA